MDVQQLFKSLRKEAECPLCLETVKDPKTLPCLHSFCLVCLDKHANYARRQLQTAIKCPVCQASFQIPQEDTFGGLPASFHLNRLVDLLALADGGTQVQSPNNAAVAKKTTVQLTIVLSARAFSVQLVLKLINASRPQEVTKISLSTICRQTMSKS